MLYNVKTLTGYQLYSLDGEIGHVKDFLFDDRHWTIRYLVADTGNWLTGRQVLISPYDLVGALRLEQDISVDLTRKQIEDSPSLDSDQPVSRQFEDDYYRYYDWPMYYSGTCAWGSYPYIMRDREQSRELTQREKSWDPNLRSTHTVSRYHIEANDGGIGHVADFILDDETWAICYLVVDTQNWWPGKKVLISPQWLEDVSWSESKVFVKLSREAIKQAPEYMPDTLLDRDYEDRLHGHYGRKTYWADELVAK